MKVRPGYKLTEVGVIPDDWSAKQIGDDIDLLTGHPFPSVGYKEFGVRLLRGSNVKRGEMDWNDDITQHWPRVTTDIARYQLQVGDLVIAMDGSLVGRSFAQLTSDDLPALLLQRVARIRSNKLDVTYLAAFVGSDRFVKYADSVKTVTAIPHISPGDIRKFTIMVPPSLREQRAIAGALSDVDALLSGLDRLIAKKVELKHAAMHQLLAGQTRLPGFHGEWEVMRLGQLGSTYGGLTRKTKADFGNGEGQFITFMNVMSHVKIDCESFDRVRLSSNESQNRVMRGDLLLNGSSETPEEVAMCSILTEDVPNLYLNSFCFGFRLGNSAPADGLFLTYLIRSGEGREVMKSLAQGSTRYNLSKGALLDATVRLPSMAEQITIAAVLSDLDAELSALAARRDKTTALKQGMAQELLTGKTRLVPARLADA